MRFKMHVTFGSDGFSLHFPTLELSDAYEEDLRILQLEHYEIIRNKYGIWASYQNKFVATREELHPQDSTFMEDRYHCWTLTGVTAGPRKKPESLQTFTDRT